MNDIILNHVYSALLSLHARYPQTKVDVADLQRESVEADEELRKDLRLFRLGCKKLQECVAVATDQSQINAALIEQRIWAMNLSSTFDNLANSLADALRVDE